MGEQGYAKKGWRERDPKSPRRGTYGPFIDLRTV